MNVLIPTYTRNIRHPVNFSSQVDVDSCTLNRWLRKKCSDDGHSVPHDSWYTIEATQGHVTYTVLMPSDMWAEFLELRASNCNHIVLVGHSEGHSFAIGNV